MGTSHRPLGPHENVRNLQANIEGLSLFQLSLRDKLVEDGIKTHAAATEHVLQLTHLEQWSLFKVLYTVPKEVSLHYIEGVDDACHSG